jgi:glycosyltransferase involved in cell wall biosynthesis
MSYFLFALLLIPRLKKIDVVYAVSTPLIVGVLGYVFSKIFKAKFVFEVTDLWPDVFIEMGLLKNRLAIAVLKKMELFCYRKAEAIIALSELLQKKIQNRVAKREKVILITNGVDEKLFRIGGEQKTEINKIKTNLRLDQKFICMYLGAHGLYNSLHTIIKAANILKDDNEIHFIFIGDGDEKEGLKSAVKEYELRNVTFIPPVPRNKAPVWLQVADVFLLPNLKGKFYEMNLQNKFFDFLASAKPTIFAGSGISAGIIERSQCGKVVDAEDFQAMARAVKEIKSLSQPERDRLGENGRRYVLKHFERNALTKQLIKHIEGLARTGYR